MNQKDIRCTIFVRLIPRNIQIDSLRTRTFRLQCNRIRIILMPSDTEIRIIISVLIRSRNIIRREGSHLTTAQMDGLLLRTSIHRTTRSGDLRILRLRTSRAIDCQLNRFGNRIRTARLIWIENRHFLQLRLQTEDSSEIDLILWIQAQWFKHT